MTPYRYIKRKQILWALRAGKKLRASAGERGEHAYVNPLEENLFDPISDEARADFDAGDGTELKDKGSSLAKMGAAHSSSALSCNVFHYWRKRRDFEPIAKACGLPSRNITEIRFEQKYAIDESRFDRAPNLDVVLTYDSPQALKVSAIESKFSEAYGSRAKPRDKGLSPKYVEHLELWRELPALGRLAKSISPGDDTFRCLHAAQLIKHILGLKARFGVRGFRLLYLWYQVPGADGACHQEETSRFAEIARQDGVQLSSMTYQDLILSLSLTCRHEHPEYIDYIAERYL